MKRNIIVLTLIIFSISLLSQEEISKEIIKGEYLGKIDEKKPPSELNYDIFEIIQPYGRKGSYIYDLELQQHSEITATPLPVLASKQLRKPQLGRILTLPITISNITTEGNIKQWELAITDETGEVFKTFAGKGTPPKTISWEGKDSKNNTIDLGKNYSYYLRTIDEENKSSFKLGKEIRIPGLYWKEEINSVIRLDGRRIFNNKSAVLTETGTSLLEEAADYVRKDIKKHLRVIVYSENEDISMERTKKIANFLLDHIILPEKAMTSIVGYESSGENKTDRIDITIR